METFKNISVSTDGKWAYHHDVPYLVRHINSGTFYIRKRFGKNIVQRSLRTKLISEAKERLPDLLVSLKNEIPVPIDRELPRPPAGYQPKDEIMATVPRSVNFDPNGATKFSEAAAIFLDELNSSPIASDATKRHRASLVLNLLRTWNDLDVRRQKDLTPDVCREFFTRLAGKYSSTHYNAFRWVFRAILQIMRERDAQLGLPTESDPMAKVRRLGVRQREIVLPSKDEFNQLLTYLDGRWPKIALMVRVSAYTGARWLEVTKLRWGDVDFRQKQVRIWCAKRRRTGSQSHVRYVPLIPDAYLFFEYWKNALQPFPQDLVTSQMHCEKQIALACEAIGIQPIRFHDCRHYFATRCIEAGVDIPTVAKWLGHLDGGVLALRVYGHLRNDHSQQQAARIALQEHHEYRNHAGVSGTAPVVAPPHAS
jgi:integrase